MYLVKNDENSGNLERREQIAIDFMHYATFKALAQFANLRRFPKT